MKINKGKVVFSLAVIFMVVFMTIVAVDFIKYPEEYLSTWKYQLENDLIEGNEFAIEYYNNNYVANGKYLFGDRYISGEYLDLATVVGYDTTENGILLHTTDGNGYYIEK